MEEKVGDIAEVPNPILTELGRSWLGFNLDSIVMDLYINMGRGVGF